MRRALEAGLLAATATLAACAADGPAGRADDRARIDGLAATERAFAARAQVAGVKPAFLEVLADDATLFRPGPVDGRGWFASHPDPAYRLAWQPQRVAVAASGDLGFSTGPYRLTTDAAPSTPSYGQFFSVWRHDASGRWRLLVDHGADYEVQVGWDAAFDALDNDGSAATDSIAAAEARFARASLASVDIAYRENGSPRLRVLRDGRWPVDQLGAIVPDGSDRWWTWTLLDSGQSRANDLGWAIGRYRVNGRGGRSVEVGYYVRVWRAEAGVWKVLGDVLAETPAGVS